MRIKKAGEDWFISDSVTAFVAELCDEIRRRGGEASPATPNP